MKRLIKQSSKKLDDLKQKLDKANADLEKRLARNEKLKEKLKQIISKIDYFDTSDINIDSITNEEIDQKRYYDKIEEYKKLSNQWYELTEEEKSAYWSNHMDVVNAFQNFVDSVKKVPELEEKIQKAQERYDKQYKLEHTYTTQVPEIFKEAEEYLAKKWQESDIYQRELMKETYQKYMDGEITREQYNKKYGFGKGDKWNKTDEEFYELELQQAKAFIVDLYNRVKKITGENILSWKDLHYNAGAINGIVYGEDGTAKVESILAGGYNIQRLHVRVLVNEINKKLYDE